MKINLGSGYNPEKGYINCDILPECKPDVILDLEKPLPFEDNSVDKVYTCQVLEHIKNFTELMIEIYRVLKPGGELEAKVPLFPCRAAVADPDHIRFFVPETFVMFCDPTHHPYFRGVGLFEITDTKLGFNNYSDMTPQESKNFFTELKVNLRKAKWIKDNGKWVIQS